MSEIKRESEIKKLIQDQDFVSDPEDEDFNADTEELEEASLTEASSADEAESGEDEDFDVQVINNQFQKLKFNANKVLQDEEEVDSKEELLSTTEQIEIRSADLPEADENDEDFNPCDASISDDSESETEELSTLEIKQLDSKHKRTGLPLTELNINADQMKLPLKINQTI
jgi:hypothetical protein